MKTNNNFFRFLQVLALVSVCNSAAFAQVAPSSADQAGYEGLLAAASQNNSVQIQQLAAAGAEVEIRDSNGRTPLHVAAFGGNHASMRVLVAAGADPNALDNDRYDMVTIAAVANDLKTLNMALALGNSAKNITSRYDGTALIAAAHLGHTEVVYSLIRAGAPLDHVNNLRWTAVIESIVLGNGGKNHIDTLGHLIQAGANINLADGNGQSPLKLAKMRGYSTMVKMLEAAGAR